MVGIAQLVSAPDCGSGGRGFESLHPPHSFLQASPSARLEVSFRTMHNGMSPSGKATDFDSVIREFEPRHPCQERKYHRSMVLSFLVVNHSSKRFELPRRSRTQSVVCVANRRRSLRTSPSLPKNLVLRNEIFYIIYFPM